MNEVLTYVAASLIAVAIVICAILLGLFDWFICFLDERYPSLSHVDADSKARQAEEEVLSIGAFFHYVDLWRKDPRGLSDKSPVPYWRGQRNLSPFIVIDLNDGEYARDSKLAIYGRDSWIFIYPRKES